MVPVPGRKGATVQVAMAEPTPVTPMPYPTFRIGQRSQPSVASTEVVAIAERPLPDPKDVAAQLAAPVLVATANSSAPQPAARPELVLEPAVQAASMMAGAPSQERPLDVIGAWLSDTFSLGAAPAPLGQTRPSAPLLPPVGIGEEGQPVDPMFSGSVSEKPMLVADQQAPAAIVTASQQTAQAGGWAVQIGAPPTEEGAASLLTSAAGSVSGLGSFQPHIERFEKNGQTFYRARFVGFGGRADATAMCSELKKAKMSCLAMQS
jgi:D-alanyl-D-alanine carboxypeptidase